MESLGEDVVTGEVGSQRMGVPALTSGKSQKVGHYVVFPLQMLAGQAVTAV